MSRESRSSTISTPRTMYFSSASGRFESPSTPRPGSQPGRPSALPSSAPALFSVSTPPLTADRASVEARTNCLIASMSGSTFRELVATEPGLAQALLPVLVRTIRGLNTRVFEFSTLAVNNRIQAELLRLAGVGSRQGNSARIVPAPTHVEIASRVSTHREAVTRELNRLAKIGIIERRGGTLLIKDLAYWGQMVQDATGEPFRLK